MKDEILTETDTLADTDFWDKYWANRALPDKVNPNFSFDRCLAATLNRYTTGDPSKSVFEVGCAPGKWLLYFKEQFGHQIFGIDNSPVGIAKTYENWRAAGVDGRIFEGDFMTFENPVQYDIVVSFGFIEHFADPGKIVARHVDLLNPGGRLILGIPNFAGVNRTLQAIFNPEVLKKHNLTIMNKEFFENIGPSHSLTTKAIQYIGGFEPELFIFKKTPSPPVRLLRKLTSLTRNHVRLTDKFNHPFFSCYLVAVYEKPSS